MPKLPFDWPHPITGLLPEILQATDPRPIADQLNDRYAHGGGFRSMKGFTLDPATWVLTYPNDPPCHPLATAVFGTLFRKQRVIFYDHADLLVILEDNGAFEVTRVD